VLDTTFHQQLNPARGGSMGSALEHLNAKLAAGLTPVHFGINFVVWAPAQSAWQTQVLEQLRAINVQLAGLPREIPQDVLDALRGVHRPDGLRPLNEGGQG
jgi:hypothetical protein